MSLFNIFGGGNSNPAPASTPAPTNTINNSMQQQTQVPNAQNPNNVNPLEANHTKDPNNQAEPTSPLDQFNALFDNNSEANKRAADATEDKLFDIDSVKLQEAVQGITFGNPAQLQELYTKAQNGDPAAFMEALQLVARDAYLKSTLVQAQMSDRAYKTAVERSAAQVPDHVKQNLVHNNLVTANANFAHPAVQQLARDTSARIQQANPHLTPEQVAIQTQQYMEGLSTAFAPKPNNTTSNKTPTSMSSEGSNFQNFFNPSQIFN